MAAQGSGKIFLRRGGKYDGMLPQKRGQAGQEGCFAGFGKADRTTQEPSEMHFFKDGFEGMLELRSEEIGGCSGGVLKRRFVHILPVCLEMVEGG